MFDKTSPSPTLASSHNHSWCLERVSYGRWASYVTLSFYSALSSFLLLRSHIIVIPVHDWHYTWLSYIKSSQTLLGKAVRERLNNAISFCLANLDNNFPMTQAACGACVKASTRNTVSKQSKLASFIWNKAMKQSEPETCWSFDHKWIYFNNQIKINFKQCLAVLRCTERKSLAKTTYYQVLREPFIYGSSVKTKPKKLSR